MMQPDRRNPARRGGHRPSAPSHERSAGHSLEVNPTTGDDPARGNVPQWEKRVRLWRSALDRLARRLESHADQASRVTRRKVDRLKDYLDDVSRHIDHLRHGSDDDRQAVQRQLDSAWTRFLDALAEASHRPR